MARRKRSSSVRAQGRGEAGGVGVMADEFAIRDHHRVHLAPTDRQDGGGLSQISPG